MIVVITDVRLGSPSEVQSVWPSLQGTSSFPSLSLKARKRKAYCLDTESCLYSLGITLTGPVINVRAGWPSGLRRWFKAPVTSVARVRISHLSLLDWQNNCNIHDNTISQSRYVELDCGQTAQQLVLANSTIVSVFFQFIKTNSRSKGNSYYPILALSFFSCNYPLRNLLLYNGRLAERSKALV